jgi:hypothetical protein
MVRATTMWHRRGSLRVAARYAVTSSELPVVELTVVDAPAPKLR